MNQKNPPAFIHYFLAIVGSLSTAGASMTILALSASFYTIEQEGVASSFIYVVYYLGVGVVGFCGGWILQRFTTVTLGICGALLSSCIVFYLAFLTQIPPSLGLPAAFFIFFLNGIDHPNNLNFFNQAIQENKKMAFFSLKEGTVYLFGLIAPALAAFIIQTWGTRICFLIDGGTYLLCCLPWLVLREARKNAPVPLSQEKPNWLVGFQLLFTNCHIRALNLSRLLNNLSYVTWTTSLPLLLAKTALGNTDLFAQRQGISTSIVSAGFILASFLGIWLSKQQKLMATMVWSATLLGFCSIALLALSLLWEEVLYVSAFFLGIGTYCFRIAGMTLGQAFTPEKNLASVIVAGDTIVRGWSFIVSLASIGIFGFCERLEMSTTSLVILITILPTFSLFSPFIIKNLVKIFVERNGDQKKEETSSTTPA